MPPKCLKWLRFDSLLYQSDKPGLVTHSSHSRPRDNFKA